MISGEDADFHPIANPTSAWAEVFSVGFSVPEDKINVRVYLLFRPQFGVVQSCVLITSKDALTPWQADYADFRPHVPAPTSLTDFELENGLSLQTLHPNRRWRLKLDDGEGVAFDVMFEALAQPFSPFDVIQNPLASAPPSGVGHFEQSGRMTGTLTVRGSAYLVNSPNLMNHGWGPRPDRFLYGPTGGKGGTWLHAHFADGSAVYGNWGFNLASPERLNLKYGYVLADGNLRGLVSGEGRVHHDTDNYPISAKIRVEDQSGASWTLTSHALHRALWYCWPNIATFSVLAEWKTEDDRIGYGDILQFTELSSLIAAKSWRGGRDASPSPGRR